MEYHGGDRWSFHVGDFTDPDDPRGREITGTVLLGVPTGEFTRPIGTNIAGTVRQIRGTWGAWIMLWRWGIRIAFAGPILGRYPTEEA